MIEGNEPDNVMDDVFDSDRDRGGDIAPSDDAGQPRDDHGRFAPKDDVEAASEQPAPDLEPSSEEEEQPDRRVPLSELQSERRKRQEYEARIAEIEQSAREREAVYQQQLRQLQPQQQQPQQEPDIFDDPDAYFSKRISPIQQQFENARLDMSEGRARDKFGDDVVEEAMAAAQQAGALGHFAQQRHPYGELVQWFQREKTLAEVGPDTAAYRSNIEKEVRAQVLAELKSGQTQGQPQARFPTSLADQTHTGGQQGGDVSPQALLDDMFRSDRVRR